jgi:hypothetical protein
MLHFYPKITNGNPLDINTKQTNIPISNKLKPIEAPKVKKVSNPDILEISDEIGLKKFDLKKLGEKSDGKRVGIVGMSGSGKSRLMIEIARENADIPAWCIINPSETTNKMYQRYVENEGIIHDSPNADHILEAMYKFKKRQMLACSEWAIPNTADPIEYKHDVRGAIILDDCQEDKKVYRDNIFRWIYFNSRNSKAYVFILVQYLYQILKEYRKQLSHLFIFRVSSEDDYKTIYKECGACFSDNGGYSLLKKVFAKGTENRSCIVLDLLSQSPDLKDRVFWYRAQFKQESFKVGASWFNQLCKQHYDPNWRINNPDSVFDDLEYIPQKKKGKKEKQKDLKVVLLDEK